MVEASPLKLAREKGSPARVVYVQHNTAAEWYVREQGWKPMYTGQFFDMTDVPFDEKPVARVTGSIPNSTKSGVGQVALRG